MLFESVPNFRDERATLTKHATKKYASRNISAITTVVLHHSLTKSGTAKAFSNYHVNTHKWPGIGYHFVIEQDGAIIWCNDLSAKSYHVGNSNIFCVGICLVGDFRTQKPTDEQMESLYRLSKAVLEDLNLKPKNIKGHSQMPKYSWKACPVINMDELRKNIEAYIDDQTLPTFVEMDEDKGAESTTYIVQRLDTLWGIAEDRAHTTVRELLLMNSEIDPRNIRVGQKIRIK